MTSAANLVGTRLGMYEIQALLGNGGMASVYRAFDHNLHRVVAIKVLSAATAQQVGFAERFRQEARLIASLRHPNIVQIYDFGEQSGYTYMVQELLPGPTLEQKLLMLATQGGRLSGQEIVDIIRQLAAALDAAHAAGIIHRDVKPGNALWNALGALALTDFGIAKNTLTATSQTQVGIVMGTPDYLSPEQAQGLPLTPASDIYSLGVVLYQMITGTLPFESPTPMGVVLDHIQTPPPLLRPQRPDLPPAAEAVVLRALAKAPQDRYASAGELARALEQAWQPVAGAVASDIHQQATRVWTAARPAVPQTPLPASHLPAGASAAPALPQRTANPAPGQRSGRLLPVLGALLVLLLLGGALFALRGENQAGERVSATVPTVPIAQATVGSAEATTGAPQEATPIPEATAVPAVQPNPTSDASAVAADPISQLRELLAAGGADGRVSEDGKDLVEKLDEAQRALDKGDTKEAEKQLHELQKKLLEGPRKGVIDAEFAREVLAGIDAVADSYGLNLPFSVTTG